MWHLGIDGRQFLKLRAADNRIHKEATGIALFGGVRQFRAANVDNNLPELLWGRGFDAFPLKFSAQVTIFQVWFVLAVQLIADMRDEEAGPSECRWRGWRE